MAHIRIEMDRGRGWEVRQEGDADVTAERLIEMLPAYAASYPHRAFLDGALVGEIAPRDVKLVGGRLVRR